MSPQSAIATSRRRPASYVLTVGLLSALPIWRVDSVCTLLHPCDGGASCDLLCQSASKIDPRPCAPPPKLHAALQPAAPRSTLHALRSHAGNDPNPGLGWPAKAVHE